MARWELKSKHYLNSPGIEWEHNETDRDTGRAMRTRYAVPLFLDPEDATYYNYPGQIVVAWEGKGQPRDIVFVGAPTPDMEPLDDEAEEISRKESVHWKHPMGPDAFPSQGGFADGLLQALTRQLENLVQKNGIPQAVENPIGNVGGIDAQLFAQLQETVAKQQALIDKLLAGEKLGEEDEGPLPELTPTEIEAEAPRRRV